MKKRKPSAPGKTRSHVSRRIELVTLAQNAAETFSYPSKSADGKGYRAVVVVTDETGDFVGVGMNTAGDDADRILRCAIAGEQLIFHEAQNYAVLASAYSRKGQVRGQVTEVRHARR